MQNWSLATTSGVGFGGVPSTTKRPLRPPQPAAKETALVREPLIARSSTMELDVRFIVTSNNILVITSLIRLSLNFKILPNGYRFLAVPVLMRAIPDGKGDRSERAWFQ